MYRAAGVRKDGGIGEAAMDKYEILALVFLVIAAIPVLYLLFFVGRIIAAAISDYRNRDQMAKEAEAFGKMVGDVKSIPLPKARAEAEALFSQPSGFTRAAPADATPIPGLSAELQEFFALHGDVTAEEGEVSISRLEIAPYEHDKSFLRLGQDGEHTHLAAKPGESAVYVIADDVPRAKQVEESFPSIHHYLLFVDRRG
jgi:hypothetical protein